MLWIGLLQRSAEWLCNVQLLRQIWVSQTPAYVELSGTVVDWIPLRIWYAPSISINLTQSIPYPVSILHFCILLQARVKRLPKGIKSGVPILMRVPKIPSSYSFQWNFPFVLFRRVWVFNTCSLKLIATIIKFKSKWSGFTERCCRRLLLMSRREHSVQLHVIMLYTCIAFRMSTRKISLAFRFLPNKILQFICYTGNQTQKCIVLLYEVSDLNSAERLHNLLHYMDFVRRRSTSDSFVRRPASCVTQTIIMF